jgi:hypothetical protein
MPFRRDGLSRGESVSPFQLGGKHFAFVAVLLMCISTLAQVPVSGNGTSPQVLDRFDEKTTALALYLDKDATQVSFTLPANAKVQDASMKLEGVLPPVIKKYAVGSAPVAVRGADLDKDGNIDLAVVNSKSDSVSVLLNDGHGNFNKMPPLDYMVAHEPQDLVLADLDKDGKMDMAAVNSSDGSVTVRLSTGDLFSTNTAYHVKGNLSHIYVGDMDKDGYPDLVVIRRQFPVISVLYNKGDGTFNPPVDVSIMAVPEGAALIDVDRDGRLDIVLASSMKPYSIIVVRNLGGKSFDDGVVTYSLDWPPSDLMAANLTGHGQDLVVPSIQGNITIFPRVDLGFGTPYVLRYERQQAVFPADLNNDGLMDLVTISRWDSTVRTFINKGGGNMTLDQLYITGSNPNGVFVADLDGDGASDIATADSAGGTVSVALNNGRGRFAWFDVYDLIESDKMAVLGDLDGDDRQDLVSTNYAWQSVTIGYNSGKGQFTRVQRRPGYMVFTGGSGGSEPFFATIADYNGDGRNDIEYGEELSSAIIMMFNNGDGTFREDSVAHMAGKNLLTAPAFTTLPVDVNGDGSLDIVTTHFNHDYISVLLNDGTGHFQKRINHSMEGNHPFDIVADDFDHDGHMDFITANMGIEQNYESNLTFIRNDGKGNLTNVMNLPVRPGPKALTTADMNGDGKMDILVAFAPKYNLNDIGQGDVSVILATDTPMQYKAPMYFKAGVLPGVVHATDLNDDNKPDVICLNQGTGATGTMLVFINKGDGSLEPQIEYPGVPFRHVAFGDLNDDGRDEVVVPALGRYVEVYRALYFPGNVGLSGPTGENLEVNAGILQTAQQVNLTASVNAWLQKVGKGSSGNVTYRMNLTAGRAGIVRVSGLSIKYKVEKAPVGGTGRDFSEQGIVITLVLLGMLVLVSLSVGQPKAPEKERPRKGKGAKTKPHKHKHLDRGLKEPGPVIIRAPAVQVKAGKDEWDKVPTAKATAKKVEKKPPAGPPVKVEVVSQGWRPSKQTVDHSKFEKAAEHREDIKKEKDYKKKKNH